MIAHRKNFFPHFHLLDEAVILGGDSCLMQPPLVSGARPFPFLHCSTPTLLSPALLWLCSLYSYGSFVPHFSVPPPSIKTAASFAADGEAVPLCILSQNF